VKKISRRQFLAATSMAIAAPAFVPASALGWGGATAASNRVNLGIVGWGLQGPGNTEQFLGLKNCQVVAACDVDKEHLQNAVLTVNRHYGNQACKPYHDYREMTASREIDAVMIAVPDNWHALIAIEAARNKKDIYGEKPLARTIAEQQAIVRAVQENKCVWQTGSWRRSQRSFRRAAEIVRNGLIGKVTRVEVGILAGNTDLAHTGNKLSATDPPPHLDYDFWLGPADMEPYIEGRVHMNWRWNYNTGGGQLLDWVGHHCDIAHWGLGFDNGGPFEVEGQGEFPAKDAVWNTCTKCRITCKYPDDITMIIAGGHNDIKVGTKWIGTEGWVFVDQASYDASNIDWFGGLPASARIKLYKSDNHHKNFIDGVITRQPCITPVETAHHSAIPGHLGLISMLVGRKIKWNVETETIADDAEATALLGRPYRAPWKLA